MKVLLTILIGALLVGTAMAEYVDFDNVPYSPGFYLQGYPAYSTASKAYDSNGDAQEYSGDSWSAMGFGLRPAYYGMMGENRWMVSAWVPFNSVSPSVGDSEAGIGDIQMSAAYWLIDDHKQGTYFSFWFWADLPVGDDTKGLGTGQANLRPGVAWAMDKPQYRVQASVYYNLRMKYTESIMSTDVDVKYGNELWANFNWGYYASPTFTPGVEVQTGWGQDGKIMNVSIPDSKSQWFRTGPYFEYQVQPNFGLKVAGLYNVMGKNSNQSFDIQARATWGF
ncbi:MAG: transporter [candidate division Zixibacteria bacterium]|nr:transporter [candidate division Zixibacteria bacterium]